MRSAAMFSLLSEEQLQALLTNINSERHKAGEIIFRAGSPADRLFLIQTGRVKIYKLSARGDEQILHLYGKGKTFGEAAMWVKGNFPAFAEAVTDITLITINRRSLRAAINRSPDMAMGMIAGMSAKLREFAELIEALSLKEVPARVAGVLLAEAKSTGTFTFKLGQTKRQLAAQIGTVAETLSRALGQLKSSGLIEVKGSQITLLDVEKLSDLAENG